MASVHPIPNHVKQFRGTDRADRKASNPVVWSDVEGLPDVPEWLANMHKQSSFYRDLSGFWQCLILDLNRLNLLSKVSLAQIEGYFFDYRVWRESVEEYNNGDKDAYKIIQDARKSMRYFEDRWGLNPSYQQKINWPTSEAGEKNEFFG